MILALDYGERHIGIAITDPEERLALRHSVIDQKQQDVFALVRDMVTKEMIQKILVGVPVSLDGAETAQTRVSVAFIEKLQATLGGTIEVLPIDETLTSVEAEARLKREGIPNNEAHAEAARIMLEDYLRTQ